ncbi:unnamed protein product [Ceratitis capitata]|uniref:(Mediterranean fruit fly) hypothetical protein n=1 Tax=Ceratitis capitata TaxID=7213 RepID=A0A811UVV7_CERCA|nr:unnamed protein product [Ceratitis capitata]
MKWDIDRLKCKIQFLHKQNSKLGIQCRGAERTNDDSESDCSAPIETIQEGDSHPEIFDDFKSICLNIEEMSEVGIDLVHLGANHASEITSLINKYKSKNTENSPIEIKYF